MCLTFMIHGGYGGSVTAEKKYISTYARYVFFSAKTYMYLHFPHESQKKTFLLFKHNVSDTVREVERGGVGGRQRL